MLTDSVLTRKIEMSQNLFVQGNTALMGCRFITGINQGWRLAVESLNNAPAFAFLSSSVRSQYFFNSLSPICKACFSGSVCLSRTCLIASVPPGLLRSKPVSSPRFIGVRGLSCSDSSSEVDLNEAREDVSDTDLITGGAFEGPCEAFFAAVVGGAEGLVILERGPKVRVCWLREADFRRVGGMIRSEGLSKSLRILLKIFGLMVI